MATWVRPPPKLTISGWADRFRYLSSEASAEPGRWSTARAEYLRGFMDACSDPAIEQVVLMKSSQVGGTEALLNVIGFHIDYDPAPILALQPNETPMAEAFSKDRIAPMVRDCPSLRGRVADAKSRDSGNTVLHKKFLGGHLTIGGANSPAGLASRPIRIVLADEVDRWPASAGTEGDPLTLAIKRTATFWNRKIVIVSTPTLKGLSRVETAFEETDKRHFHVPCPKCGFFHVLRWGNVVWPKDNPAKAELLCPSCAAAFSNGRKNAAVRDGEWRASGPFNGKAGFHINELYSPWTTLAQMAVNFLESKANPERLKVFVNTSLAETWEGDGETVSDADLVGRTEKYAAPVPARALALTAGVDTQPDRLEVEIVGWGAGEESWSIDHVVLHGDPDIPEGRPGSPWTALTDLLRKPWAHEWGIDLAVSATCIDSGGANTQAVYDYAKRHKGERIFAIKGRGGEGLPIVGSPNRKRTGRVKRPVDVFIVGVDQAKDALYRRLAIKEPGPGYCHFPAGRESEWFRQLTAEKRVTKYSRGFARREWVKAEGRRNEALDCRVYATAALFILAPQFDKLAFRLRREREEAALRIPKKRVETPPVAVSEVESAGSVTILRDGKTEQDAAPQSGQNERHAANPKPTKRQRRGFVHSW